jgi:hypothetical protein
VFTGALGDTHQRVNAAAAADILELANRSKQEHHSDAQCEQA